MKNKIMVLYTIAISSILLVSVATVFAQIPSLEQKPDSNISSTPPAAAAAATEEPEPPTTPTPSGDNKLILGPVTIPLDKSTKLQLNTADSKITVDPKK